MCLGKAVVPPTQKAQLYVFIIRLLIIAQMIIIVTNFVASNNYLRQAIFGIFFLFVLYVMQHQLSYQVIMINIFISLYFSLYFLISFLTPLQNGKNFKLMTGMEQFAFADGVLSFTHYTACFIFLYYPYRQFKIIEYNKNPILRNHFQNNQPQNALQSNEVIHAKQIEYAPNYGNLAVSTQKNNQQNANYEVSKGKGVIIG